MPNASQSVSLHDLLRPCNDLHLVQLDGNVTLDHENEDLTPSLSPVNDQHLDPLDGSVTPDPANLDHTPELSPVNLASPDFMPLLNSTPTQELNPDSNPPGLLDSLTSTNSDSLKSWSDLDSYLPFATVSVSSAPVQPSMELPSLVPVHDYQVPAH